MENELLKQCKDEVAVIAGYADWCIVEHRNQQVFLMNEVCELYSSKLRDNDRKRIEELTEALKELHENTLYQLGEQDDRPDRAPYQLFDKVESALSGEATKEKDQSFETKLFAAFQHGRDTSESFKTWYERNQSSLNL